MLFTQQILALALAGLAFSAPLPDAGAGETNPVRDFVAVRCPATGPCIPPPPISEAATPAAAIKVGGDIKDGGDIKVESAQPEKRQAPTEPYLYYGYPKKVVLKREADAEEATPERRQAPTEPYLYYGYPKKENLKREADAEEADSHSNVAWFHVGEEPKGVAAGVKPSVSNVWFYPHKSE